MDSIINLLKEVLKLDVVDIDNSLFKLHYRVTTVILLCFSAVVSTNQFFGSPINCIMSTKSIPEDVINNYCWIQSTYTLANLDDNTVGWDVAHPGVDTYTGKEDRVFHQYYQWVVFYLFFQACLFYLPFYFWTILEGGKIRQILLGLSNPIIPPEDKHDRVEMLAKYLIETHGSQRYAYYFFGCEMLNFINVVFQIFLTDSFLGGGFSASGFNVFYFSQENQLTRKDPIRKVFPVVTKCTFNSFGPSGDVQEHDALCVLPVNVVNEKIFAFLFVWFVMLAVLSGIFAMSRIPVILFMKYRIGVLAMFSRYSDHKEIETIVKSSTVGDWLIVYLLRKNMDPLNYKDLVTKLDAKIQSYKQKDASRKINSKNSSFPANPPLAPNAKA